MREIGVLTIEKRPTRRVRMHTRIYIYICIYVAARDVGDVFCICGLSSPLRCCALLAERLLTRIYFAKMKRERNVSGEAKLMILKKLNED